MTIQQHSIRPPTPPTTAPGPHRRTRWYIAAATVFVLGLLTAGAWAVSGVVNAWEAPDSFARSTLPGAVTVQVTDTGKQWLYYEHTDGTTVASLDQLGIRITAPAGEVVAPQGTSLTMEYDAKTGDLGTAIGTFNATTPGTYTVTAGTTPAPGTALAVGPSVAQPLKTPLLGAAAVLGLCSLTSTGLVITGLRRR
jgi:hypothetical protein